MEALAQLRQRQDEIGSIKVAATTLCDEIEGSSYYSDLILSPDALLKSIERETTLIGAGITAIGNTVACYECFR